MRSPPPPTGATAWSPPPTGCGRGAVRPPGRLSGGEPPALSGHHRLHQHGGQAPGYGGRAGGPGGAGGGADRRPGPAGPLLPVPRGCGLYLTALLRPQLPPIEVVDFTAWVAVAVCDGIQAACGVRPRIKWTNDIVLEGKKLCGILTEMGLENEINALQYLVTGIGVNVNQRPEDFSPDVRPIAASLFNVLGRPVRRSELAVQIIRALDRMYSAFPQGKADYLARYRADCLTPGNRVQLITPASRTEATALSIDDEFRLVVEYDDGRRRPSPRERCLSAVCTDMCNKISQAVRPIGRTARFLSISVGPAGLRVDARVQRGLLAVG